MTRIFIDDLSNTFRDAVRITRELGGRYLWIDSLCIIQDNEDDWAREAKVMAKVYANSHCTLAALSSKNSTEGCRLFLIQHTISSFVDLDVNYWGPMRIRVFDPEPVSWGISGPLTLRAWTLRERELSRRNIHFGEGQLLWECHELKAYAQIPWQQKNPEDSFSP